jgi:hypothetical protein
VVLVLFLMVKLIFAFLFLVMQNDVEVMFVFHDLLMLDVHVNDVMMQTMMSQNLLNFQSLYSLMNLMKTSYLIEIFGPYLLKKIM